MNFGRLCIAAIVSTIVYYVIGFATDPIFEPLFKPYSSSFRAQNEIFAYFPLGILGTLIAMFVFGLIYASFAKQTGVGSGVRAGLLVALIIASACDIHDYAIYNIGASLAAVTIGYDLIVWTICGAIFGLVYKRSGTT